MNIRGALSTCIGFVLLAGSFHVIAEGNWESVPKSFLQQNNYVVKMIKVSLPIHDSFDAEVSAYRYGVVGLKIKGAALLSSVISRQFRADDSSYHQTIKLNAITLVRLSNIKSHIIGKQLNMSADVHVIAKEVIAKHLNQTMKSNYQQKLLAFEKLTKNINQGLNASSWESSAKRLIQSSTYQINVDALASKGEVRNIINDSKVDIFLNKIDETHLKLRELASEFPYMEISDVSLCEDKLQVTYRELSVDLFFNHWLSFYNAKKRKVPTYKPVNAHEVANNYACFNMKMVFNKVNFNKVYELANTLNQEEKALAKELDLHRKDLPSHKFNIYPPRKIYVDSILTIDLNAYLNNQNNLDVAYVSHSRVKPHNFTGYHPLFSFLFEHGEYEMVFDLDRSYDYKNRRLNNKKHYVKHGANCHDNSVTYKRFSARYGCNSQHRVLPMIVSLIKRNASQDNSAKLIIFDAQVRYDKQSLTVNSFSIKH